MNYKTMTIEDIIKYCVDNDQVEWLKTAAAKEIEIKVYPKKTYIDKNGKERTKGDKTQEPIGTKKTKISFVELKNAFCEEFMPEIAPKKEKKASMYDIIAAL